ncbi:hypothetical protein [Arcobacter peruensis]|uniref:hypothetical protein n=1 Tax=Arcobacter peruensis TaxID=2320140 RepID=UPI000F0762C7|nr:hypothetical protein [Arcobacter peruensis]
MNYKNIIKTISSLTLILLLSGCTHKLITYDKDGNIIEDLSETKTEKIEKIIYKRPAVSLLLKNRIRDILKAMSKNDLIKLNQEYIHPSFGFYNLYKIDGAKVIVEQKMIYNIVDEETEEISHIISRVKPKSTSLKIIEKNVKFDCSPNDDAFYGWNDDGLFLSNKSDFPLLKMMKNYSTYKQKDFQKAEQIENTSYKVVLTPELSFYLTFIDNNWYITLIDRITTDCSSPDY